MLDFGQLISENLFPVAILIFGGMLLYFGKVMQDIQVESGGKFQYYSYGIIFCSVTIIIPVILSYLIYKSEAFLIDSLYFWLFLQMIILAVPLLYILKLDKMRQEGISIKKTKNEQHPFIGIFLMSVSLVSWIGTFYIYALLIKYPTNLNYLSLLISIIAIIFIMTFLAMIFSYYNAFYPTVRIHMDNLSIVKGKLIKYDETLQLVVDNKLVRINRNKILFVEELD